MILLRIENIELYQIRTHSVLVVNMLERRIYLKKLEVSERALKDLIEAFRSLEQQTNSQKKILDEYKYILERSNQEISRLGDSLNKDSNITSAIKMANEGKSIDEISNTTGMSKDEIEPIMKYHGK